MFDEGLSEPLLGDLSVTEKTNTEPGVLILRKVKACLPATDKILAALYVIFLIWQTAVLVPYAIHTVYCCFQFKLVSFQCKESSFPNSLALELVMMISIVIHTTFILWLLGKTPHFLGYKQILNKLSRLPAFWSLLFLVVMRWTGLAILQFATDTFFLFSAVAVSFACHGISTVALVGVLNYTQGKYIKQQYPDYLFVFFKATLAVFLAENLVFFITGSLQLASGVAGLGPNKNPDVPHMNQITFKALRHFSSVVFYYKLSGFLWHKMFIDNINILGHYEYL